MRIYVRLNQHSRPLAVEVEPSLSIGDLRQKTGAEVAMGLFAKESLIAGMHGFCKNDRSYFMYVQVYTCIPEHIHTWVLPDSEKS